MTGKVKRAHHSQTGQQVAIKIINKSKLTSKPTLRRKVEREIAVMKLIDHPHLIKLFDVLQTRKYLFLIIEYVEGGELFDYIVQKGKLTEQEAFHFFKQIIEGMEYCHNNLVCHRDLKPENLLLNKDNNIKIADFGMASLMSEDFLVETSCGSPHYASPEVVTGGKYNGMMADVWSCGVILFALLAGTLPFDDENLTVLLSKVKKGAFKIPAHFADDVKDLVQKMLAVNPKKRIPIARIQQHPWWRRMEDEIAGVGAPPSTSEEKSQQESDTTQETQLIDLSTDEEPSTTTDTTAPSTTSITNTTANLTTTNSSTQPQQEEEEELDEEHADNEDHSIADIDDKLVDVMISMGWQDKEKLCEALRSQRKNIETVTYRLLEQRSQGVEEDAFNISPKLKVSVANPIMDPVDPLEEMKRRIHEAEKLQQEHEKNQDKKQGFLSKLFKPRKKADSLASFELKSDKEESDLISDLTRVFNELRIGWKQTGNNLIRATCTENPVEFDVSMSKKDDGQNHIKFLLIKGNPYTADAIINSINNSLEG